MFRPLISAILSPISYLTTPVWGPLANKAKPWVFEAWRLCSLNSKIEPFYGFTLNLMLSRFERWAYYFRMSTRVWYFQRKGRVGQLVSYSGLYRISARRNGSYKRWWISDYTLHNYYILQRAHTNTYKETSEPWQVVEAGFAQGHQVRVLQRVNQLGLGQVQSSHYWLLLLAYLLDWGLDDGLGFLRLRHQRLQWGLYGGLLSFLLPFELQVETLVQFYYGISDLVYWPVDVLSG